MTVGLDIFLNGLIFGCFVLAAPVGPIGVLCIRRTLAGGRAMGLASGLGAATADAAYASVAAFGLTFVSAFLVEQRVWLGIAGGLFLVYLGVRTLLARPAERAAEAPARGRGLLGAYASTFFLTITNPMTILTFVAAFAGLGLANAGGDYISAALLVLGVFTGSALWWLLLSAGVGLLRERFGVGVMLWVNRVSGAVILAFGIVAVAGAALR